MGEISLDIETAYDISFCTKIPYKDILLLFNIIRNNKYAYVCLFYVTYQYVVYTRF